MPQTLTSSKSLHHNQFLKKILLFQILDVDDIQNQTKNKKEKFMIMINFPPKNLSTFKFLEADNIQKKNKQTKTKTKSLKEKQITDRHSVFELYAKNKNDFVKCVYTMRQYFESFDFFLFSRLVP